MRKIAYGVIYAGALLFLASIVMTAGFALFNVIHFLLSDSQPAVQTSLLDEIRPTWRAYGLLAGVKLMFLGFALRLLTKAAEELCLKIPEGARLSIARMSELVGCVGFCIVLLSLMVLFLMGVIDNVNAMVDDISGVAEAQSNVWFDSMRQVLMQWVSYGVTGGVSIVAVGLVTFFTNKIFINKPGTRA